MCPCLDDTTRTFGFDKPDPEPPAARSDSSHARRSARCRGPCGCSAIAAIGHRRRSPAPATVGRRAHRPRSDSVRFRSSRTRGVERSGGRRSTAPPVTPRMRVRIPYTPRRWARPFHASLARWSSLVLHRRAGKTTVSSFFLLLRTWLERLRYEYRVVPAGGTPNTEIARAPIEAVNELGWGPRKRQGSVARNQELSLTVRTLLEPGKPLLAARRHVAPLSSWSGSITPARSNASQRSTVLTTDTRDAWSDRARNATTKRRSSGSVRNDFRSSSISYHPSHTSTSAAAGSRTAASGRHGDGVSSSSEASAEITRPSPILPSVLIHRNCTHRPSLSWSLKTAELPAS